MKTYMKADLDRYLENDWIMDMIRANVSEEEKQIRTNQWLMDMDNKRLIYADVYGDFLKEKAEKKILDVGGGYNSLTKVIAANSQYTLLDFMAHGGGETLQEVSNSYHFRWLQQDWYNVERMEDYDIVIANDIFPDVDQRIELFIEKMLPHCHELRMVVTYYNTPCFYTTKRTDDSEIMTFLSWDGEILGMKLQKYINRSNMVKADIEFMKNNKSSIYYNGRQVAYVVIRGDL